MKWLMILLVLLFTSCSAPASAKIPAQQATQSTVSIQVGSKAFDRWETIGTGVAVHKRSLGKMILTAAHVSMAVPFDYRACHIYDTDSCIPLEEYIIDSGNDVDDDWALYIVNKFPKGIRAARIGPPVKSGDQVMTLGFPDGDLWFSHGHVSTEYTEGHVGLDLWVRPGNSGGGVWDARGRLVGIIHAVYIKPDLYGLPQLESQQSIMVPVVRIEVF